MLSLNFIFLLAICWRGKTCTINCKRWNKTRDISKVRKIMEINEEAGKNCYKNIKNGIIIRRKQCNDKNISSHSEIFMVYGKWFEKHIDSM